MEILLKIRRIIFIVILFCFQMTFAESNECLGIYSVYQQEMIKAEKNKRDAQKLVDRVLKIINGLSPSYFTIGNYIVSDSKLVLQRISDNKNFSFHVDDVTEINSQLGKYGDLIKNIHERAEKIKKAYFSFSRDFSKNKPLKKAFVDLFSMHPKLEEIKKELNGAILELESKNQTINTDKTLLEDEVAKLENVIDLIDASVSYNKKNEMGSQLDQAILSVIIDLKSLQAVVSAASLGIEKHIRTLKSLYDEVDRQKNISMSFVYNEYPDLKTVAENVERELFAGKKQLEKKQVTEVVTEEKPVNEPVDSETFCVKKDLCNDELVYVLTKNDKSEAYLAFITGVFPDGTYSIDSPRKPTTKERKNIARTGYKFSDGLSESRKKELLELPFDELTADSSKAILIDDIKHKGLGILDKVVVQRDDNSGEVYATKIYGILPTMDFIIFGANNKFTTKVRKRISVSK